MNIRAYQFKEYTPNEFATPDPVVIDPEYKWCIQKLNEIVGGRVWKEVNYHELNEFHYCLRQLDPQDFYKIFLCFISWHQQDNDIEDMFSWVAGRMGFLVRKKDLLTLPQHRIDRLFPDRTILRLSNRAVREMAVQAFPYSFIDFVRESSPNWQRFLLERASEYSFALFIRWLRRVAQISIGH